ncbi:inward rectifier potassium channel protein [Cryptosporidium felis]|nr:inward rectifier potassium channel protein [Cryptosporidium felis]
MNVELSKPLLNINNQQKISNSVQQDEFCNQTVNNNDLTQSPDSSSSPDSPNILMENGTLNILHQWDKLSQFIAFCLHDRFHVMLSMNWGTLILFIFFSYILFAVTLAIIHFLITFGNTAKCIGSDTFGQMEYFFYAVETMFSIGYGSPRSPSCLITNYFTPIMVICGSILNSITVGIFFTKFSESTSRKWAICFSKELCGIGFEIIPSEISDAIISCSNQKLTQIRASEITSDHSPFIISFRLINVSQEAFFSPELKIFLIVHCNNGPLISEVESFNLDVPLEFMESPVTVSIFSNQPNSPLSDFTINDLKNQGQVIELMVLLRFFDSRTSKNLEVRKTWKLNNISWGYKFSPIIRKPRHKDGTMYQVEISDVDNIEPVIPGTFYQ